MFSELMMLDRWPCADNGMGCLADLGVVFSCRHGPLLAYLTTFPDVSASPRRQVRLLSIPAFYQVYYHKILSLI
ncbi:hypothetical protein, partial [Agrobacterium vitis]|uniref:hypothetical protein n=1 Tax=Agrobacterium vitis TaxID=373 RepID=UPI001AED6A52